MKKLLLQEFITPPPVENEIRKNLKRELNIQGYKTLQEELKKNDFFYYQKVDLNNTIRVIRALEVIRYSKKPFSFFLKEPYVPRFFSIIRIGINTSREILYYNINKRVEYMMEKGLLDEVCIYYPYRYLNALQTLGYKELFQYLEGKITLKKAIENIKINTRHYAKRQLSWFRKYKDIIWFNLNQEHEIIKYIKSINMTRCI